MGEEDKEKATALQSLIACLFYGFVSISITFFNKAVLALYHFDSPNIMTLFQILFSLCFLVTMKRIGVISYASMTWTTSVRTSPLSISFLGMVLTGLGALKYLNIPMFNSLRRLTTPVTMIGESVLLNIRSSFSVQASVWFMLLGAFVASVYDFDFSLIGYILVGLNCFFTAAYLLSIAKFGKQGLNTWGLMWYNNVQSLPLVILLCWFNGDFVIFYNYSYLNNVGFWICFLFQSALAFLLNYSIFLCTNINSALATSVTGQIKNIATTAAGYFMFNDVTYDPFNVIGLAMGVAASSWYSWLKYVESEKSKKPVLPLVISDVSDKLNDPLLYHEDHENHDDHAHSSHVQEHSHSDHGHSHADHSHPHTNQSHSHSHSHGASAHGHSHGR